MVYFKGDYISSNRGAFFVNWAVEMLHEIIILY